MVTAHREVCRRRMWNSNPKMTSMSLRELQVVWKVHSEKVKQIAFCVANISLIGSWVPSLMRSGQLAYLGNKIFVADAMTWNPVVRVWKIGTTHYLFRKNLYALENLEINTWKARLGRLCISALGLLGKQQS
jgi:hypothetical protein